MPPEGLNHEEINAFLKFLAMNVVSKGSSRLASFRLNPFVNFHWDEARFGAESTALFVSEGSVCGAAGALTLLVAFSLK